jgi:lipopolysaccharide biosynthesis regulator YciM
VALLSSWTVAALVLLAGAAGFYAARRPRPDDGDAARLRADYLRGLNFLANDQPDRALETFTRVVEVDRDTVEVHLALGALFRRRGELDRAIRLHQGIVARERLEPALREQALYALAHDYLAAGLHDRAEQLFAQLAAGGAYRLPAMRELVAIYERERDWTKAIDLHRRLARVGHPQQETAVLHYLCELAEAARAAGRLDEAREHLRAARASGRRFPRVALVRADIAVREGDAVLAMKLLGRAIESEPGLIDEALPRVLTLARAAGLRGTAIVDDFVAACAHGPRELAHAAIVADALEFESLAGLVRQFLRADEAVSGFLRAVGRDVDDLDAAGLRAVGVVLRRLAVSTPRHRCAECGFASRARFWQCPACKTWDSQRPMLRFGFAAGHADTFQRG